MITAPPPSPTEAPALAVPAEAAANPEAAVAAAVARARSASASWGSRPLADRVAVLRGFRKRLVARLEEVADTLAAEVGKPRFDAVNEVLQAAQILRYCERNAGRAVTGRTVSTGWFLLKRARVTYRPLGVVGIITPWNYPVVLTLSPIAQALIMGNAVVLKPSERATATARLLHAILAEANPPAGIFQVVEGGPEAAVALASAAVDKVAFTGGTMGGRAIARAAAERLTPVLLELGGNDAMIVAADAPLDRAARAAVWGGFMNAGQSCIGVQRVFVERPIAADFTARVVALTRDLKVGRDAALPAADFDLGPLISTEQFDRVHQMVRDAQADGATLLCGGDPTCRDRRLYPPTVLTNVRPDMAVMREEIFGPVLVVHAIDSLAEAVDLTNQSRYGLSASIWTASPSRGARLAEQLAVGGVVVNDCLVHFAISDLPFGGVKQSGIGRSLGLEGLREFAALQTITTPRFSLPREFHWFPYGQKSVWIARAARWLFG